MVDHPLNTKTLIPEISLLNAQMTSADNFEYHDVKSSRCGSVCAARIRLRVVTYKSPYNTGHM